MSTAIFQSWPSRAALNGWLCSLRIRVDGERESVVTSSSEYLFNWLVESVENGWTPREFLVGIFPAFGGLLHGLIAGITESG